MISTLFSACVQGLIGIPDIDLPEDIWLIIVKKAAEDPEISNATLASLRLVNKTFHAAVRTASFALRPNFELTYQQQIEFSRLLPELKEIYRRGCGGLAPSSRLGALHDAFPNLSGLHVRSSFWEGTGAVSLEMFSRLQTLRLRDCKSLRELPKIVFRASSLTSLALDECSSLRGLPPAISCLSALSILNLNSSYHFRSFFPLLEEANSLEIWQHIRLHDLMPFDDFPEGLFSLPLQQLKLSCGRFRALPEGKAIDKCYSYIMDPVCASVS